MRTTLQEGQAQSMAEAQRQKQYYNQKIGTVGLKPGNLILVKADAFQGKRKIKNRWEDKPHKVVCQIMTTFPHMKQKTSMEIHASYIATCSCLIVVRMLAFPCTLVSAKHGMDVPAPPQSSLLLEELTARQCHKKTMVWSITQHQARKTSLGWINGKLQLLPWTSARASTEDG